MLRKNVLYKKLYHKPSVLKTGIVLMGLRIKK